MNGKRGPVTGTVKSVHAYMNMLVCVPQRDPLSVAWHLILYSSGPSVNSLFPMGLPFRLVQPLLVRVVPSG